MKFKYLGRILILQYEYLVSYLASRIVISSLHLSANAISLGSCENWLAFTSRAKSANYPIPLWYISQPPDIRARVLNTGYANPVASWMILLLLQS